MKRAASFLGTLFVLSSSGATAQSPAPGFEFHGYMRSGLGFSRGGTEQVCFAAPGAPAKFRLGNECDTYFEASLLNSSALGPTPEGTPRWTTKLTFAGWTHGDRDWESTKTNADGDATLELALREVYVQAEGVLGSARPWVGKRFYRRQDVHILDYYLLANSGPCAGVEGIDLGFGRLHLAVTRNVPNDADGPAQTNTDVRLSDVGVGFGKLEAVVIHGAVGERGHATGEKLWEPLSGTQLSLIHTADVLGGFNRLTLQYGQGLFGGDPTPNGRGGQLDSFGGWGSQNVAKGATALLDAKKASTHLRVAEELVVQPTKPLAASFVALYEAIDFDGYRPAGSTLEVPGKTVLMVGTRPVYHFTDHAALAFEYGLIQVGKAFADDAGKWQDVTLHKATIAPQVTATSGFWARPQLRLFATYATWNDEAKGAVGGAVYAGETAGFSTGAQVEAWW